MTPLSLYPFLQEFPQLFASLDFFSFLSFLLQLFLLKFWFILSFTYYFLSSSILFHRNTFPLSLYALRALDIFNKILVSSFPYSLITESYASEFRYLLDPTYQNLKIFRFFFYLFQWWASSTFCWFYHNLVPVNNQILARQLISLSFYSQISFTFHRSMNSPSQATLTFSLMPIHFLQSYFMYKFWILFLP